MGARAYGSNRVSRARLLREVARDLPVLARCLSGPVVRDLSAGHASPYARSAFADTAFAQTMGVSTTVLDALAAIFDLLRGSYRADYVYRNAIARKLFAGRHRPDAVMLSEVRAGRSKVDVVVLNETSVAYEIKTELDSLRRLDSQMRDYSMMFDRIYVVTFESQARSLHASLPAHVGIISMARSMALTTEREALPNADNVQAPVIVNALRHDEVAQLTKLVTGGVPSSTQVGRVDACLAALFEAPPRLVHDAMVRVLKNRLTLSRKQVAVAPRELLAAYMESGVTPQRWESMTSALTAARIADVMAGNVHRVFSVPPREKV